MFSLLLSLLVSLLCRGQDSHLMLPLLLPSPLTSLPDTADTDDRTDDTHDRNAQHCRQDSHPMLQQWMLL